MENINEPFINGTDVNISLFSGGSNLHNGGNDLTTPQSLLNNENQYSQSNQNEYIVIPELNSSSTVLQLFIIIILFILYLCFFIYISCYDSYYKINFSLFLDFFINGTSLSQKNLKEFVETVVEDKLKTSSNDDEYKETFISKNSFFKKTKESINNFFEIPLFYKLRNFINKQIIKLFYVKGNTIYL